MENLLSKHTNRHQLYAQMCEIVGEQHVTDAQHALRAYAHDSSVNPAGPRPGLAVAPGSTAEISKIAQIANEAGISIVPRGGGASIHGYTAGRDGVSILLDMARMRRIVHIDTQSRFVTAQAGIMLGELAARVAEEGFFVHTVGVPQYVDSLGGVMSGQEGGGQNLDNNPNWRYVLGFKVVLANGDIVETGAGPGTNVNALQTFARTMGAPDLTGLFLGDCGTFGIKIEVTLQIFPIRAAQTSGAWLFSSFEDQWAAMSQLMEIEPYLDNLYTQHFALAPESTRLFSGNMADGWSFLYGARAKDKAELTPRKDTIDAVCASAGGKPAPPALIQAAADFYVNGKSFETGDLVSVGMWQWNEAISQKQDAREHFGAWREHVIEELEKRDITNDVRLHSFLVPFDGGRLVFHATNLFFDNSVPGLRKHAFEIEERYRHFVMSRGYFTENTQGRDADAFAAIWSKSFKALMTALKNAIDPNCILNPGAWNNLGLDSNDDHNGYRS